MNGPVELLDSKNNPMEIRKYYFINNLFPKAQYLGVTTKNNMMMRFRIIDDPDKLLVRYSQNNRPRLVPTDESNDTDDEDNSDDDFNGGKRKKTIKKGRFSKRKQFSKKRKSIKRRKSNKKRR
jgi:hypothetical protein